MVSSTILKYLGRYGAIRHHSCMLFRHQLHPGTSWCSVAWSKFLFPELAGFRNSRELVVRRDCRLLRRRK